jgi:hypothetical protein
LKEDHFVGLYSDKSSRPNVAVNMLTGYEVLKAGFVCSGDEKYAVNNYDMQVQYTFGYPNL